MIRGRRDVGVVIREVTDVEIEKRRRDRATLWDSASYWIRLGKHISEGGTAGPSDL